MTENKNTEEATPDSETEVETPEADTATDAPEQEEGALETAEAPPESGDGMSLEAQVADLKDKLLRALAENENTIRRAKREREDAGKYAAANFARDMLSVSDNLHRAMAAIPDSLRGDDGEVKSFLEGVEMTGRELLSVLERHGIVRISPMGEKFDHEKHEALFEVPTAEADPGTVVQVVEDGFLIHDRLLRPARVGVAKAAPEAGESEGHAVDTSA